MMVSVQKKVVKYGFSRVGALPPPPQDLTLQKTNINVTLFVLEYLKETFASH